MFVNFFERSGGGFDRLVFREAPLAGAHESDNHTVGRFADVAGTPIPVPGALALMGVGLFGLGLASARSRRAS